MFTTRRYGILVLVFLASLSTSDAATPHAASRWWRELPTKLLLDDDCRDPRMPKWQLRGGRLKSVEDACGREVLQAESRTELRCGDASWERYVATAEVKLGEPHSPLGLAVATTIDEQGLRIGYQVGVQGDGRDEHVTWLNAYDRGGSLFDQSHGWQRPLRVPLRTRPDVRRWHRNEAARKRAETEFASVSGWRERCLQLRVELMPRQVRLWVDGLLVTSVESPAWSRGGVRLVMHAGDRVRLVRVETLPGEINGSVPLDLTSRFNGDD